MKRQSTVLPLSSLFKNAPRSRLFGFVIITLVTVFATAAAATSAHGVVGFALGNQRCGTFSAIRSNENSCYGIRIPSAKLSQRHEGKIVRHFQTERLGLLPATSPTSRSNPSQFTKMLMANNDDEDSSSSNNNKQQQQQRVRNRDKVKEFAKNIAKSAINVVNPKPGAIAAVISDSAINTAEIAAEEVFKPENIEHLKQSVTTKIRRSRALVGGSNSSSGFRTTPASAIEQAAEMEAEAVSAIDAISLARTTAADAFFAAETAIENAEVALNEARVALNAARAEAAEAIAKAEENAAQAAATARRAEQLATSAAVSSSSMARNIAVDGAAAEAAAQGTAVAKVAVEGAVSLPQSLPLSTNDESNAYSLTYEEVDYHLAEMAPPFIGEDQCLVPGEAVVRVEKAPENSRRIFAGIDIMAAVDDVWKLLTDYEHLQDVVPNLVVNDVLELYNYDTEHSPSSDPEIDPSLTDEQQCEILSKHMKGSKLRQVGGAKVVGINFSARTTLEVREWPNGMPDFAHFRDEVYEGKSRDVRAKDEKGKKLTRYRFPRPFALSTLPTRDISMQSIENDDGEFRMYQGVWRMQPLPGCAPEGQFAMRLTYAVEISPRAYLPVALIEGRIAQDLCANLRAIRDFVSAPALETTP